MIKMINKLYCKASIKNSQPFIKIFKGKKLLVTINSQKNTYSFYSHNLDIIFKIEQEKLSLLSDLINFGKKIALIQI